MMLARFAELDEFDQLRRMENRSLAISSWPLTPQQHVFLPSIRVQSPLITGFWMSIGRHVCESISVVSYALLIAEDYLR